jgi:hypothetical protein
MKKKGLLSWFSPATSWHIVPGRTRHCITTHRKLSASGLGIAIDPSQHEVSFSAATPAVSEAG